MTSTKIIALLLSSSIMFALYPMNQEKKRNYEKFNYKDQSDCYELFTKATEEAQQEYIKLVQEGKVNQLSPLYISIITAIDNSQDLPLRKTLYQRKPFSPKEILLNGLLTFQDSGKETDREILYTADTTPKPAGYPGHFQSIVLTIPLSEEKTIEKTLGMINPTKGKKLFPKKTISDKIKQLLNTKLVKETAEKVYIASNGTYYDISQLGDNTIDEDNYGTLRINGKYLEECLLIPQDNDQNKQEEILGGYVDENPVIIVEKMKHWQFTQTGPGNST